MFTILRCVRSPFQFKQKFKWSLANVQQTDHEIKLNSYNFFLKTLSGLINSFRKTVLFMKMFLILKCQLKMLHWEKQQNKGKVL